MPGVDFSMVRSLVTIEQVLDLVGYEAVSVSHDRLRGPCPVHGSSSPHSRCFSVNLTKNTYHCFKCGSEGNQLDLWMALTKSPLFSAAIDLCERLRVDVPLIHRW